MLHIWPNQSVTWQVAGPPSQGLSPYIKYQPALVPLSSHTAFKALVAVGKIFSLVSMGPVSHRLLEQVRLVSSPQESFLRP